MRSPQKSVRRLLTLVIAVALAVPTLGAAAPLVGDNFEADDGNLIVNSFANVDWNTAGPQVDFDLPSANDDSFTMGAQEDNPVQNWGVTTAPVNAKADIIRTYTKAAFPFFRLGIVRNQQANGTVAYHVEFNQSTAKHPNGLPVRTVGDALVVYDFQGNNTQATLTLHRWIASGACVTNAAAPCWGTATTLNATQAVGADNQTAVLDTVANPDETLAPKTFDELAINLATSLGLPQNRCINFGQVWLKTREGGAFGSALQDLMGPLPIHVGNCDVAIEKDVVAVSGTTSLNPASAPFNATLGYRIRVFLGPNSAPVAADQLAVSDTTVSDTLLTNAPLVPVLASGKIVGDDGDNVLEQGERWVYALNATGTPVVQVATTCADVVNSAKVAVTSGDTDLTNNKATRTTPVACVPDIAIDKSGPASVGFGDTITYTVDVSNVGDPLPIARADLHVTDPAVAGAAELEFASVVTGDADTLLEQGDVWRYKLAGGGAVTIPGDVCTPIDNTAIVAAVSGETNVADNQSTATTIVTCTPDIAITKSGPASVGFGDTITYTVDVSNVGDPLPIARADLHVTDPAVTGATELEFSAVVTGDADTLLEKGEVWRYVLSGAQPVTLAADVCAPIDNTAIVAAVSGETNVADNQSTVTTIVACTPDIAVTKSGPAEVEKGATITYTVDVTSVGDPLPIRRADLHVTDPAVAGTTALEFSSVVTGDADTLLEQGEVWRYEPAGGGAVILPASTCGNIANTALVETVTGETNLANNTSSVTTFVRCPDYTVVKTPGAASVPFSAGTVSWSVEVTNTGNVDLANPVLADATVTLAGPSSSLGGEDDPAVFQTGEVLTYTGTEQIADRCGQIENTVSATVQYGQVHIARAASATTTVVCTPNIAITKSGPPTLDFGATISYAVTVTSVGDPLPIPRADIHVTDPAVAGTTELVFSSETNGDGDTLLEPGETWTYSLPDAPLTLAANQCTPIDNTAIVAQLTGETDSTDNQSTVTTNVICTLNLTIAKTSDKATYAAGETITYTVTVTNSGQSAVPFAAIQVSDPTLPGLVLVGEPPVELASGQSATYTGTRQTTPADCGSVPNTATVVLNVDAQETTLQDNSATHTVTVTCTTDIAIVKRADKATYAPGETITYSVTVTNTGQLAIAFSAIQVSDPTLPNLTLVGTAPQALAPGEILTYTGSRQVTAANCGQVPNTATVALVGDVPTETTTANNTSSVSVAVAGPACSPTVVVAGDQATGLSITKVGPKSSQVRKAVRYTLRITNTGPVAARNVIVRDPVPSGMTVAKLPVNATFGKGQVRWSIGDLQPGQSVRVQVLLRAEGNVTRRICNVGFASGSNAPEVNARACTRFLKVGRTIRVPVVTG